MNSELAHITTELVDTCLIVLNRMGDFQKFEQDFYQSGYYVDGQQEEEYCYDPAYVNPKYHEV